MSGGPRCIGFRCKSGNAILRNPRVIRDLCSTDRCGTRSTFAGFRHQRERCWIPSTEEMVGPVGIDAGRRSVEKLDETTKPVLWTGLVLREIGFDAEVGSPRANSRMQALRSGEPSGGDFRPRPLARTISIQHSTGWVVRSTRSWKCCRRSADGSIQARRQKVVVLPADTA